jgi:pSer/pThr/pTyr-binding forkhead associated (FHA) protein
MDVRLVFKKSHSASQVLTLPRDETLVGRQSGCDIRIPSSEVSRRHCMLRKENGVLTVEDLQSVNGTYLNGQPVVTKKVARPGDRLQIGPATFIVEYQRSDAARTKKVFTPNEPEPVVALEEDLPMVEILEDAPLEGVVLEDDFSPIAVDEEENLPEAIIEEVPEQDANAAVLELADEGWELPDGGALQDLSIDTEDKDGKSPKRRK